MEDPSLVGRGKSPADLPHELDHALRGQPPDASQQRAEVLAVDVFHRDEVLSFGLDEIVDAAHAGMGHETAEPHLLDEAHRQARRVRGEALGKELRATVWRSLRSSALQTSPIPPRPRSATMR